MKTGRSSRALDDENNIFYQINCSDNKAVYFGESKWSQLGIGIVKRMKLRNIVGKQITTLSGIRRKLLIGNAQEDQRNYTLFEES